MSQEWFELLRVRQNSSKKEIYDAWVQAFTEEYAYHTKRMIAINTAFNEGCDAIKEYNKHGTVS